MDMEIQARIEAEADAQMKCLVEAYEKGELSEYLEELMDSAEIKCDITGDMMDFEFTLCGGGSTGILGYEYITVSWGREHHSQESAERDR